ncbi:hypothetical protein DPEC_G00001100 [Dallia pectoralis]|uniref:Uncharacterized protein n=1 Tax=Dallia pectoralis TaxID=75939 RepID=A0ACC2HK62_DALPE|nr:hypothetical protein DPEC_G00001100 [Dallia pectoralis]
MGRACGFSPFYIKISVEKLRYFQHRGICSWCGSISLTPSYFLGAVSIGSQLQYQQQQQQQRQHTQSRTAVFVSV